MEYIYIAKNKLMPGFCKIGTSTQVEKRLQDLYGEWELHKKFKVEDGKGYYYETKIKHKMKEFSSYGYELFNCPVSYLEKIVTKELNEPVEVIIPDRAISIAFNVSELSKHIKSIRKNQKLTQEKLAGACNVSPKLIIDIEKGKQTCEIGKVLHVARMLGIKLYGLLPLGSL